MNYNELSRRIANHIEPEPQWKVDDSGGTRRIVSIGGAWTIGEQHVYEGRPDRCGNELPRDMREPEMVVMLLDRLRKESLVEIGQTYLTLHWFFTIHDKQALADLVMLAYARKYNLVSEDELKQLDQVFAPQAETVVPDTLRKEISMNDAAMALPAEHPIMKAWKEFCDTDEFKNALMWAVASKYDDGRPIDELQRERHAKGSMWLAFTKGMEVGPNVERQ